MRVTQSMLPIAIITGASSGIGWAFAEILGTAGTHSLLLTGRREERLLELKSKLRAVFAHKPEASRPTVEIFVGDLLNSDTRNSFLKLLQNSKELDLLINNAGFGSVSSFATAEPSRQACMVELNCRVPLELCRAVLPSMLARGKGRIINVCSTVAFLPVPYMATYSASKAFLLNFSLALGAELRGSGVQVLAHCPGPTESEFHLAAGLKKKLSHVRAMTAERVAGEALRASAEGKKILVNGTRNRLLALACRLLPPTLAASLVERKLRADLPRNYSTDSSTPG